MMQQSFVTPTAVLASILNQFLRIFSLSPWWVKFFISSWNIPSREMKFWKLLGTRRFNTYKNIRHLQINTPAPPLLIYLYIIFHSNFQGGRLTLFPSFSLTVSLVASRGAFVGLICNGKWIIIMHCRWKKHPSLF